MNIGVVGHNYHRREGTGGYLVELVPRLAAAHEVTLYAARVREPVPDGVRVVRVPAVMARAATAVLSFPVAFRTVRRPHDLLHAQGWVTSSADVVTAHIVMAAWRAAARSAGLRPPFGERVLGPLIERRERRLYRRGARHVIAPSEKVRAELAQRYGRDRDVAVIPHGFPRIERAPDRAAARKALGLPSEALVALYVGDVRKGLEVAARTVAACSDWHLAVVTRSTADSLTLPTTDLSGRLHWIGQLTDMRPAYAAADVLLHPTVYDSFSFVVAEAMAHGLPPLVTPAAGITELLEHGVSGWILQGDPAESASAALLALGADPERRERIGKSARSRAAERPWDTVASETLALYEAVRSRTGG